MAFYLTDSSGQLWRIDANTDGSLQTTAVASGTADSGDAVTGPVTTGQDMIKRALRMIGGLSTGENMTASMQKDGLEALNALVDSWNAESMLVYSVVRQEFTLLLESPQTIGPGGDLNTSRPQRIEDGQAYLKLSDGSEFKINVVSQEKFAEYQLKTSTGQPYVLYYDGAFPQGNIFLYPVPDQAYTAVLYTPVQLAAIDLSTEFTMPKGYLDALTWTLAVELSPEYGKKDVSVVLAGALQKKQVIARANIKPLEMRCDQAVVGPGGSPNIFTGGYR